MKRSILSFALLLCMILVACSKTDIPAADCSDIMPAELSTIPFTDINYIRFIAQSLALGVLSGLNLVPF